jgi:tetratricopeptide (TPR) repeat protein/transcriptional regulator with XRE-family HTH domain
LAETRSTVAKDRTSDPGPQDARAPDIGGRLREWRERTLLTQEQLAERAGISVRTIRRYERSGSAGRPQSASIRLLADALGLSPTERAMLVTAREPAPVDSTDAAGSPAAWAARIGSSTAPTRQRQLPAPPPLFTGREPELADLERISDPADLVIITISGMAGIGKTALALQAAHRVASRYPDEQIYLDLHGYARGVRPIEPGEALERILRSLDVPADQIPPDPDDRAALYRSRLAGHRALIVLDNAATEAQVVPLLPGTPGCLVLVTSRRSLTALDHRLALFLDLLPPPDAVRLFTLAAGEQRVGSEPAARLTDLIDMCGRLPLAIRIAAARLRSRPSWTVAHLIDRLQMRRHVLSELESGERSVTAALDLSYQQLTNAQQRAYRMLGLHPGADLDVHAAAALLDTTTPTAERLIDHLLGSHLLQEPAPGCYRFHDLVRAHSIATADADDPGPDRKAALTRLFDHYRHTVAVAMDVAYPHEHARRPAVSPSTTPAPELDDPARAIAWLDAELPTLLALARHAADHGWPDHALHLSATLHHYLRGRGHYRTAETLHSLALAVARTTGDRRAEQVALTSLGHTHRVQGRLRQATDLYAEALAIAQAIGDRTAEMDTLAGLGHVHMLQGRYAPAAESLARAWQIAGDTGNHTGELDALTGLGWQHRRQGRHEQAITYFEKALHIARDTGNRIGELHALSGLGWQHRQQGRHEQAITYFEKALHIARDTGNPHGELNAMNGLASTHRLQGRHHEATETYQRCLALSRQIGNRHLQFEILHGLGRVHCAAGRHDQALGCHREALDLATQLRQPAGQATAHDGIAHAYHALARHDAARRHWRQALDILVDIGADHAGDGEVTTTGIRAHLGSPPPASDGADALGA